MQVIKNANALSNKMMELGYEVVSGSTENHLMLIDLSNKNITGKQAENTLGVAGITVNKNMVPFDTKSPFVTSGIRIGTPAMTTRGMKENEMQIIAGFIDKALKNIDNEKELKGIEEEVKKLCSQFPLYPELSK